MSRSDLALVSNVEIFVSEQRIKGRGMTHVIDNSDSPYGRFLRKRSLTPSNFSVKSKRMIYANTKKYKISRQPDPGAMLERKDPKWRSKKHKKHRLESCAVESKKGRGVDFPETNTFELRTEVSTVDERRRFFFSELKRNRTEGRGERA